MTSSAISATKPSSTFEDIVDVFYAPVAVFERRRNAGFGLAWLIYAIVTAVTIYAAQPVQRPMMAKQAEQAIERLNQNPGLSAEQKENLANQMRRGFDSPWAVVAQMVLLPLSIFVIAFVLWLCGKLFGSAATYGQSTMITTFAAFPRTLLYGLMTAYSLATGRETASQFGLTISPALLLPDDGSPLLGALLSRFDLGTLWMTVLLGLGLSIVGRISRMWGYVTAGLVWLLASGFIVLSIWRNMPS